MTDDAVDRRSTWLSDEARLPDPQLAAQGWERRFMTHVGRLKEYRDLYTSLGYEVWVEPVASDEVDPECDGCGLILYRQIITLYTRKRKAAP